MSLGSLVVRFRSLRHELATSSFPFLFLLFVRKSDSGSDGQRIRGKEIQSADPEERGTRGCSESNFTADSFGFTLL